ncbi:MAG: hypothetical protein MR009_09495 [Sutterellaceae bacterium]|nr:hypothetical protein [Sutterellaceae bacterium]MDD7442131.1 hypothetical protein [Sutterellaceae bacterium]MDY2869124.1 hypothetical protein [Mesosutterella sp.]
MDEQKSKLFMWIPQVKADGCVRKLILYSPGINDPGAIPLPWGNPFNDPFAVWPSLTYLSAQIIFSAMFKSAKNGAAARLSARARRNSLGLRGRRGWNSRSPKEIFLFQEDFFLLGKAGGTSQQRPELPAKAPFALFTLRFNFNAPR